MTSCLRCRVPDAGTTALMAAAGVNVVNPSLH